MDDIQLQRYDGVACVTLARPARHNALRRQTLAELAECVGSLSAEVDVRCLVLTGTGSRYFAAGGDLADFSSVRSREEAEELAVLGARALDAVRFFPAPTVAYLNGTALGGGAELAMAADIRLAAPEAGLGFVQARLGLPSAWGGIIDLGDIVGSQRALQLFLEARVFDSSDCRDLGLVNAIAEGPDDWGGVRAWLAQWVPALTSAPGTLRALKRVRIAHARSRHGALRPTERAAFVDAWISDEHWRAADRALIEKPAKVPSGPDAGD